MKIFFSILIFFMLVVCSACSGKTDVIRGKSGIYAGAPEWVFANELSYPVSGSGSSCTDNDPAAAFSEAEEDAVTSLYSTLNKKVRVCLSDFFKKNRLLEDEAFARISDEMSNIAKANSKTLDSWRSPADCIFVLVVSDVDAIREAFKNKMTDFLVVRKPDGYDVQNQKTMDDLEKYANLHFRKFSPL